MPLYAYQCENCQHESEFLQSVNDAPMTTCPHCQQEGLKKKITAPAFSFKGGGWYKDLYGSASGPASKAPSETKAESKPAETKTETKTESKPATPPASSASA